MSLLQYPRILYPLTFFTIWTISATREYETLHRKENTPSTECIRQRRADWWYLGKKHPLNLMGYKKILLLARQFPSQRKLFLFDEC